MPIRLKAEDIPETKYDKLISDAKWQHHNQTFTNGLKLAMMNNGGLGSKHNNQVAYIKELILLIDTEIKK